MEKFTAVKTEPLFRCHRRVIFIDTDDYFYWKPKYCCCSLFKLFCCRCRAASCSFSVPWVFFLCPRRYVRTSCFDMSRAPSICAPFILSKNNINTYLNGLNVSEGLQVVFVWSGSRRSDWSSHVRGKLTASETGSESSSLFEPASWVTL